MDRRTFVAGIVCTSGTSAVSGRLIKSSAQRLQSIDVVDRFGFMPDGRGDNYDAFHRWAAHVNRARGGDYLFPPGIYYVQKHRHESLALGDPREARNPLIDGCAGLTINGYGAKISLNGAFHRSARRDAAGEQPGRNLALFMPFVIHRTRDLVIRGFEMDGGVRRMTRDSGVQEIYAALVALHGCTNVLLEDLDLHHCQTDGVYLTSSELEGRPGLACRNVTLRRVRSNNNARGGLGIIQVYGLTAEDCDFSDNGQGLGLYPAHPPIFGVDVEPDYYQATDVDTRTGNIEFRRCRFNGNASAFLAGYVHAYQGYLRLIDCRSSNRNDGRYHMIVSWEGALVEGGIHDAGTGAVFLSWQGQRGGNVILRNCEVRTAGLYGILHDSPGNAVALEGVKVVGEHRSAGTHGSVLFLQADPGSGRRNRVRGCDIFVPSLRKSSAHPYDYEVTLNHTVSEGNLFRTNLSTAGAQHFCTNYGAETVVRRDHYRGAAPGVGDSFRPSHNSTHDTRQAFSKG